MEGAFIAVLKGSRVDYIVLTGKKQILPASGTWACRQLNENAEDDAWLVHDETVPSAAWFKAEDQRRLLGFCGILAMLRRALTKARGGTLNGSWRGRNGTKDRFLQQQVLIDGCFTSRSDYIQEFGQAVPMTRKRSTRLRTLKYPRR